MHSHLLRHLGPLRMPRIRTGPVEIRCGRAGLLVWPRSFFAMSALALRPIIGLALFVNHHIQSSSFLMRRYSFSQALRGLLDGLFVSYNTSVMRSKGDLSDKGNHRILPSAAAVYLLPISCQAVFSRSFGLVMAKKRPAGDWDRHILTTSAATCSLP